jgi:hypothetical protein
VTAVHTASVETDATVVDATVPLGQEQGSLGGFLLSQQPSNMPCVDNVNDALDGIPESRDKIGGISVLPKNWSACGRVVCS